METTITTRSSSVAFWLAAALLILGVLSLINIPPVAVNDHAFDKHGTQADNAVWEWENGACTEVWRSIERRRVIRLVISDPFCAYGIVQTLSGAPVTAFYAPSAYWRARLAGYEMIGREGDCK